MMRRLSDDEKIMVENKAQYLAEKNKLLKKYKNYADKLSYTVDDIEEGFIKEERATLAAEIKTVSNTLREIEKIERMI